MTGYTPRQSLIALTARALVQEGQTEPSREAVLQAAQALAAQTHNENPLADNYGTAIYLLESHYFEGLTEQAQSRFVSDVKAELAKVLQSDELPQLCCNMPAAELLALADAAFITKGGTVELWRGETLVWEGLFGAITEQLRTNVDEWIPDEELRDEGNGDYIYAARKPKGWVELYSLALRGYDPATKAKLPEELTYAALAVARATHAVILNPSQDVILYSMAALEPKQLAPNPLSNGIPLAYVPQTYDGDVWPLVYAYARTLAFEDHTKHKGTNVVHRARYACDSRQWRTMPEWAVFALLVDDNGKRLDPEIMPDTMRGAYQYTAEALYARGIWGHDYKLHIENPFLVRQRMKAQTDKTQDPTQLQGVQYHYGDDGVLHVSPYIARDITGSAPTKAWVVADALEEAKRWAWGNNLVVHDAAWAASLLIADAITAADFVLMPNNVGEYHARLSLIPLESEDLAQISKRLIVASGHLLALHCKFNPTRIASTGAKAMVAQWQGFFAKLEQGEGTPAHWQLKDLAMLKQIVDQVLDEATVRELLPAIQKSAYYAEEMASEKADAWVAFVWEQIGKTEQVQAAKAEHDLELEIIGVCAWDVAKAGGFNTAWIEAKTEQVIRRQMVATLQAAPNSPHFKHWQGLNETDRLNLVRASRARAGLYRKHQERPKYLETAPVQQS